MTAHDPAPFADAATLDKLDASRRARDELRAQTEKRQLRLAAHDLAEGVRGVVRVNPLAAVFSGIALGMWVARRRRRAAALTSERRVLA